MGDRSPARETCASARHGHAHVPRQRRAHRVSAARASLLTYVASFAWRRYVGPPFFLAIATPLLIALAIIRMLVYGLRTLFPSQAWLPDVRARDRVRRSGAWRSCISSACCPRWPLRSTTSSSRSARSQVSLLTILTGIAVVRRHAGRDAVALRADRAAARAARRISTRTCASCSAKFIRAVLLVVGVLIALQTIGFDLTLLTVFGGALGVGIGLGLQKLASNYIAGFTILLDRSIRLGDMITVDGRYGRRLEGDVALRRRAQPRRHRGDRARTRRSSRRRCSITRTRRSDVRVACRCRSPTTATSSKALDLMNEIARGEPRVLRDSRTRPARCSPASATTASISSSACGSTIRNGQGNLKSDAQPRDTEGIRRQRHRDSVPAARRPDRRAGCDSRRRGHRTARPALRRRLTRPPA